MCTVEEPHWYAAYIKPRHEKSAARHLETRWIEAFLPLYQVRRHWEHRHASFVLPLFPGYLFVHMMARDRLKVLTAPGVLYLVSSQGVPVALEDAQIVRLRSLVASHNAYPTAYLASGDRVRFSDGPFAGLEGSVIRTKGQMRVIVAVDLIMRSIAIEVDRSELEVVCTQLR